MPTKDKSLQALIAKRHYEKNKEKIIKRSIEHKNKNRLSNREFIVEYLCAHPCVDCGETDYIVLEFDHVRGNKLFNIADSNNTGHSLKNIRLEIDKCEVRCANCHRRITYKRRQA